MFFAVVERFFEFANDVDGNNNNEDGIVAHIKYEVFLLVNN